MTNQEKDLKRIISERKWNSNNLNTDFWTTYRETVMDYGNELVDFGKLVCTGTENVKRIVENMKRFGIKEFTVCTAYKNVDAEEIVDAFKKCGCKTVWRAKTKVPVTFASRKMGYAPAVLLEIVE